MTSDVAAGSRTFAFGPFTLIPARQLLLRGDEPVRIGGRALDLLTALVDRAGELVTKSELLAQVWPDTNVDENNLKVNMATLRRVLDDGPTTPFIATVVGRGYRFVAAVQLRGAVELPTATSTPATPTTNLPISTTRIFGRAETISAIRRDLDQSRLVSIVGSGGVGKTTVAVAVARQALEAFGDGVWFVDLALLTDGDRIASTIAGVLGVHAHAQNMLAVVCEAVRDRQLLLVLDNCEQVIDGVAACADRLLATAAGVRILATSREPLRMANERVRRLSGLDTPPDSSMPLDARTALEFPAVQLFVERATDGHGSFQFGDADASLVAQICRSLDGLALAIELAATRAGTFGVAGLLHQLDGQFRLLMGWRVGPERHRTLAATLDWSYTLLDDRESALLRAISVFAGSFDLEGARAVTSGTAIEVLDALANLAAKSFLVVEPSGDGITCRLLETMRVYATSRLRSSGEEHAIRSCHAEHVCRVMERATVEWPQTRTTAWGATYAPVIDDLRSAVAWSGDANPQMFLRLTVAGLRLWNHLSLTEELRATVSRALEELAKTELAGTAVEMQLQMSFADTTMFTRGPNREVQAALLRTLEIADRIGDVDYRLRGLRTLGSYQSFSGDSESAVTTLERFVVVAAEHDPSAVADGETRLGISELFVGRLTSARRRLERLHRRSSPSIDDDSQLARFHYDRKVDIGNVLSYAQWLTGSFDTAAQTAAETVTHALDVKHGLSLINALAVAACPVFFHTGRYEQCETYVAMLENEVRTQGVVIWASTAQFFRSALACARGDVSPRDLHALERAVEEFRAFEIGSRRPWILAVLADALVRSGRVEDAESTIDEALAWQHANSQRWCIPEVMRIRARIRIAQHRFDEAESMLVDAIDVAQEIGGLSWRLRAGTDLAHLLRTRSRTAEARALLVPIYGEFTEGFTTRDLVIAAELIAACSEPTEKTRRKTK